MKITKDDIKKARELKAFGDLIKWAENLAEAELTPKNTNPEYFLWSVGNGCISGEFDTELFRECALTVKWRALQYAHAELAQFPELFRECALAVKNCALAYAHAELAQFPELFRECALVEKYYALKYAHAELEQFPDLKKELEEQK